MKQKCFWGIIVLSFFIIIVFGVQVEQYLEILFALIFDDNTGAEFVRNIFIAFFSIALGIPAGLEINRRWHNKQDRQRQIQLLKQLKNMFKENLGYLKRILEEMNKGLISIPSFPLDLVTLNGTSQYRHEIVLNSELLRKIDKAHFELVHVDRRLEILQLRYANTNATMELNVTESMKIHDSMKKQEFKKLYNKTFGSDHRRRPNIPFNNYEAAIFNIKRGTIELAFGLSELTNDSDELHREGGAYRRCKEVIEDIDKELRNLGCTNTES